MGKVYDNCCDIDVHKKLIVACFKCGSKQEKKIMSLVQQPGNFWHWSTGFQAAAVNGRHGEHGILLETPV